MSKDRFAKCSLFSDQCLTLSTLLESDFLITAIATVLVLKG